MAEGRGMRTSATFPLYGRVCLINGAVFAGAAIILIISPPKVSDEVTTQELAVLILGLLAVMVVNTLLLHGTLTPLDRLAHQIDRVDVWDLDSRLDEPPSGVGKVFVSSFNAMIHRVGAERATSSARAAAAEEEERRRIARELHDDVGQTLTVVLISLGRMLAAAPAPMAPELQLIQSSVRSSLNHVRNVAHGLRRGVLEDLGLASALAAMATDFNEAGGMQVRREIDHSLPGFAPEVELAVFRIAQEALTNAARHAQADTVTLALNGHPGGLELTVTDNGMGAPRRVDGAGLTGMKERAISVGGRLTFDTTPGQGFRVRLVVRDTDGAPT
jgi:two-component system sensor histidine kinase UhpB